MTIGLIPSGPAGISKTLDLMVKLARKGAKDPKVIQLARQLVAGLPQYDRVGEVKALHAFVRDHIRYTNDPSGMELLQDPEATLGMMTGDCDDKSILLGALLRSIGRPARFKAIAMQQSAGDYCHVYTETPLGKSWVALETIKPVQVGWEPKGVMKFMVRNV